MVLGPWMDDTMMKTKKVAPTIYKMKQATNKTSETMTIDNSPWTDNDGNGK